MTIIGMYVFNVSLQNFTESKKVTHKSISYAAYAAWADPMLKSYVNISIKFSAIHCFRYSLRSI